MHTLIFIYNAKSGTLNTLFDIGHKLLNPETYNCNLCTLTHDAFFENKTWKLFKENFNIDMKFYHADKFIKEYPKIDFNYPTILTQEGHQLKETISASEINAMETVEELISKIKDVCKLILQ